MNRYRINWYIDGTLKLTRDHENLYHAIRDAKRSMECAGPGTAVSVTPIDHPDNPFMSMTAD
jgi:hypothetical protein